ncbi:MAG: hypothetical protein A3F18_08670 [Legionellales bacterium RIFCSPHIGHO2_12_FULL_37_14]|nr:MAG: hypothetical protein A3F18_08670 [Legionellales bacterium RIFCSPHIGHO2_12_FULL_37_14]
MNKSLAFSKEVERLFGPNSKLQSALPLFVVREAQQTLAKEIAEAIQDKASLIAEAGTGTGKTFAYLIPLLLSRKKAIVSTATKMLQDQLVKHDLPTLMRALKLGINVQNLKGRANYLCEYRIKLFSQEARFVERNTALTLTYIKDKLKELKEGVREELGDIRDDDPVWPYATATTDNCLGSKCPYVKSCFLLKARKSAQEADLIVINHHLYFADVKLKEKDFGSLLPGVEVIIFDEAHQLPDTASDFYAQRFSTKMLTDAFVDVRRVWPSVCPWYSKVLQAEIEILHEVQKIKAICHDKGRFSLQQVKANQEFNAALQEIIGKLEVLLEYFTESTWLTTDKYPELHQIHVRFTEYLRLLKLLIGPIAATDIAWGEAFKQHVAFYLTPLNVGPLFVQSLPQNAACIYTSATLSVGQSFTAFMDQLSLQSVRTLLLPSPFNFLKQTLMYLPRGLPDTKDQTYLNKLLDIVVPILTACKGRSFFLFTSYEALNAMAEMLPAQVDFPILVQGSSAKPLLLKKFKELGNAILLGTAAFWEGVDVKGEALSCVIIDKLPFMSPADPVTQGRLAYFARLSLSGFDVYTLPAAVIALKQGVGRLIRDVSDKGIVVLADPRLVARKYGQVIFASLPPFPKTRELNKVLAFVESF